MLRTFRSRFLSPKSLMPLVFPVVFPPDQPSVVKVVAEIILFCLLFMAARGLQRRCQRAFASVKRRLNIGGKGDGPGAVVSHAGNSARIGDNRQGE